MSPYICGHFLTAPSLAGLWDAQQAQQLALSFASRLNRQAAQPEPDSSAADAAEHSESTATASGMASPDVQPR